MKYPKVSFNASNFLEETPEQVDDWFAGEALAKTIAQNLANNEGIELQPESDVFAEDWGWCICLRSKGVSFFLGVGEDWDNEEKHWKVFVAKHFDLPLRLFKKKQLEDAVLHLRRALGANLASIESATEFEWTDSARLHNPQKGC
jgi:hypothetical protein